MSLTSPTPHNPEGQTAALRLSDEQIKAMQQVSLEMFNYLRSFCEERGLLLYLCGGCCIGALRNKGFIPWDDDIDVFMPRDDYEKLAEQWPLYADTERYSYVRSTKEMVTGDLMAKLCDNTTTCVTTYQQDKDIPQGLTLDILPLDGYPDSSWARRMQVVWALVFSLFNAQSIPKKHGGLLAWGSRILLSIIRAPGLRYRIWRYAERQMSKHRFGSTSAVTELCAGPGYMRNRYPVQAFETAREVEFEGQTAPVPVGAETYLSIAFGDFMQLPPSEKRVSHHEVAFLDLATPYRNYRGRVYLKDI
ncbi:MAG: LicD family protein [Coriobacteriales bacterium]|jgi:lipopolysaccharide cholinephosphotransferase|nr:LicD family protein [Coriobacteriales bacterium]